MVVKYIKYLVFGVSFFLCIFIFSILMIYSLQQEYRQDIYLSTTLQAPVIRDLCNKGFIPTDLGNCYDASFTIEFRDIPIIIEHNLSVLNSYEAVEAAFGNYKIYCNNSESSYYCVYGLNSGYYINVYYDSTTNNVVRIE